MKQGDLVRISASTVGPQWRAPLWPRPLQERPVGGGRQKGFMLKGWIQPWDVLLLLSRTTYSSDVLGSTTEWLEVIRAGDHGWVQADGFEVIDEAR